MFTNASAYYTYPKNANVRNTDKHWYNCGGYALSLFKWYLPWDNDKDFNHYLRLVKERKYADMGELMISNILNDDTRLFQISRRDIVENKYNCKEYEIIAFRFIKSYHNFDFHFMKRAKNGIWYDKRGSSNYISMHNKEFVLDENWYGKYNSTIYFFARPYARFV